MKDAKKTILAKIILSILVVSAVAMLLFLEYGYAFYGTQGWDGVILRTKSELALHFLCLPCAPYSWGLLFSSYLLFFTGLLNGWIKRIFYCAIALFIAFFLEPLAVEFAFHKWSEGGLASCLIICLSLLALLIWRGLRPKRS